MTARYTDTNNGTSDPTRLVADRATVGPDPVIAYAGVERPGADCFEVWRGFLDPPGWYRIYTDDRGLVRRTGATGPVRSCGATISPMNEERT